MNSEELGEILEEAIDSLENAEATLGESVRRLRVIDGAIIVADEDNGSVDGKSRMTVKEFGEMLGSVMSDLDDLSIDIEDIRGLIGSLDGVTLELADSGTDD